MALPHIIFIACAIEKYDITLYVLYPVHQRPFSISWLIHNFYSCKPSQAHQLDRRQTITRSKVILTPGNNGHDKLPPKPHNCTRSHTHTPNTKQGSQSHSISSIQTPCPPNPSASNHITTPHPRPRAAGTPNLSRRGARAELTRRRQACQDPRRPPPPPPIREPRCLRAPLLLPLPWGESKQNTR